MNGVKHQTTLSATFTLCSLESGRTLHDAVIAVLTVIGYGWQCMLGSPFIYLYSTRGARTNGVEAETIGVESPGSGTGTLPDHVLVALSEVAAGAADSLILSSELTTR